MFYSHQILARKGPLATVWMAAHLQHRLKKPHYNSVDINSTVDRIIFPEAPIALRMSGHLLLGVVRIYSKKVDYLYHDCNDAMVKVSKALTPTEVNLTEAAASAPPDDVTLPERFELDALKLDDYAFIEGGVDSYTRSPEDITLQESTPLNMDHYVAITFEDMDMTPMGLGVHGLERTPEHLSPQSIEVMRHAVLDSTLPDLPLPDQTADETEQPKAEVSDKDKEFVSPLREELLESGEQPPSFQPQTEQMEAAASEESPNLIGSHLSFGHGSVELAIRSTPHLPQMHVPPVEVGLRRRKRKLYDEKSIVLSNKALKDALNDTSKIVRKKMRLPDTFIGSWRLERVTRKEHIFIEPLITGMCEDLHDMYMDLSEKPYFAITEEPTQEGRDQHTPDALHQPGVSSGTAGQQIEVEPVGDINIQTEQEGGFVIPAEVQATPAPDREPEQSDSGSGQRGKDEEGPVSPAELDMEVERLRRDEGDVGTSSIPEFTPSAAVMRSPTGGDDMPAVLAGSFKSGAEGESTFGPGLLPTPDLASSAETLGPEAVAPFDQHQIQQPYFGDVPELMKSPGTEELHFLEADSSLSGFQGTQDVNSLSVRTRAVAQYLKGLSPGTPTSVEKSASINLNDILKNKSRKLCARMFYEILVLKSFDLIDLVQNESYGDIVLKLTSDLKAQL